MNDFGLKVTLGAEGARKRHALLEDDITVTDKLYSVSQLAQDLVEETHKAQRMAELLQLPVPESGMSLTIPSVTRSGS